MSFSKYLVYARENRMRIKGLYIFVDHFIKSLVEITRALSELNRVVLISNKKFVKFIEYSHSMNLVEI